VRYRRLTAAVLIAVASSTGACGGGDGDTAEESPTPSPTPVSPSPTPRSPGQLPPAFVQCMADQGFNVTSSAEIHSAPPEVLQLCFGTLHGGGG
jgi:hypothetical protein